MSTYTSSNRLCAESNLCARFRQRGFDLLGSNTLVVGNQNSWHVEAQVETFKWFLTLHILRYLPDDVLFSLPTMDAPGIHHGAALMACTIIAANSPGRLSSLRNPPAVFFTDPLSFDFVLTGSELLLSSGRQPPS